LQSWVKKVDRAGLEGMQVIVMTSRAFNVYEVLRMTGLYLVL